MSHINPTSLKFIIHAGAAPCEVIALTVEGRISMRPSTKYLPLVRRLYELCFGIATAVSPPSLGNEQYMNCCYVSYRRHLYQMSWNGPIDYPDLKTFPTISSGIVRRIDLSKEMDKTWRESTLIDFGADSFVCITTVDPFPVLKLAHPDRKARTALYHEFHVLREMSRLALPVPKVGPEPLFDDQGIYGYRMERLFKLNFDDLQTYAQKVQTGLGVLHEQGFSHGDLHPGNVMLDGENNIVFIDFSRAGKLGEPIPPHIPWSVYDCSTFHDLADKKNLLIFSRPPNSLDNTP